MRTIAVSVPTLALSTTPALLQGPDETLVVPGQRIGKWTLEMTVDKIVAVNGTATVREMSEQFQARPVVLYFWGNFVAATRDRNRVEYLYTLPPTTARGGPTDFKTEKGIGHRSPREAVLSAYGRPTAYSILLEMQGAPYPLKARLIYDRIGLTVDLAVDSTSSLVVFRPGSAKNYWVF